MAKKKADLALETIDTELAIFDVTRQRLEEMKNEFLPLTIAGIEDKEGYKKVHDARMLVKSTRIKVEKNGADLRRKKRAEIEDYINKVFEVEKYILGEVCPVEDHLTAQEKAIDDEKARIKKETEERETARIEARIGYLIGLGAQFDNVKFSFGEDLYMFAIDVRACSEERFNDFVAKAKERIKIIQAELEAAKKAEEEEKARLAKIAAEQEAERIRLEAIAKEQAEREAKIKADQDAAARKLWEEKQEAENKLREEREAAEKKIREDREALEAEKRALEKKREEEEEKKAQLLAVEQASKKAAEQARIEAEAKIKAEAEEKARIEAEIKEREEREAAARPDREKLLQFATDLDLLKYPEVTTETGQKIILFAADTIGRLAKKIRRESAAWEAPA